MRTLLLSFLIIFTSNFTDAQELGIKKNFWGTFVTKDGNKLYPDDAERLMMDDFKADRYYQRYKKNMTGYAIGLGIEVAAIPIITFGGIKDPKWIWGGLGIGVVGATIALISASNTEGNLQSAVDAYNASLSKKTGGIIIEPSREGVGFLVRF